MLRYWQPWRRFLVVNVDYVKKWEWLYYKVLNYLYPSDAMISFESETMDDERDD